VNLSNTVLAFLIREQILPRYVQNTTRVICSVGPSLNIRRKEYQHWKEIVGNRDPCLFQQSFAHVILEVSRLLVVLIAKMRAVAQQLIRCTPVLINMFGAVSSRS
jgi:hypothetical protein